MTVTVKKRKYNSLEDSDDIQPTIDDFGQKYYCDNCSKEITHLIVMRCAICTDFDLCIECFTKGAELKEHKKNHDYRVIVSIFNQRTF
jgi:transcriptional adapter 2-alpha